jgi:hypothetical protein
MSKTFWNSVSMCLNSLFDDETNTNVKEVFCNACESGNVELVDKLLLLFDFLNSVYYKIGMLCSSRLGHVAVVDRLIQDNMIEPSALNFSRAFKCAIENEHVEVVYRLLKDDIRINPSHNNDAIRMVCENGNVEILNRLLQDSRVDPSAENNIAIRIASQYGNIDVVDRLVQDPRVDPAGGSNCAIYIATINGYVDIVDILYSVKLIQGYYKKLDVL